MAALTVGLWGELHTKVQHDNHLTRVRAGDRRATIIMQRRHGKRYA
jgi:hypothetical protein